MVTIVIIPARLNSSRLHQKLLLNLNGKSILQHTFEKCQECKEIKKVFIATDSDKIKKTAEQFQAPVFITSSAHQSGTDRISEVAKNIDCDHIINVQADEPFISPNLIDQVAQKLNHDLSVKVVSAMHEFQAEDDINDPAQVKVVTDLKRNALYFSRSPIPFGTKNVFKHVGIYGYQKEFLLEYTKWAQTPLEKIEKLEQLRILEHGEKIYMVLTDEIQIGIDTELDYQKALKYVQSK